MSSTKLSGKAKAAPTPTPTPHSPEVGIVAAVGMLGRLGHRVALRLGEALLGQARLHGHVRSVLVAVLSARILGSLHCSVHRGGCIGGMGKGISYCYFLRQTSTHSCIPAHRNACPANWSHAAALASPPRIRCVPLNAAG